MSTGPSHGATTSAAARRYCSFTAVAQRFFALSLLPSAGVMALAPIDAIRALGFLALVCAALGFAWQLVASSYDADRRPKASGEPRQPEAPLPLAEAGVS